MMMIAFIFFNSSLVPLIEGLRSSNPWDFEFSAFRWNRTDDLRIHIPSLRPTEVRLHVRSNVKFYMREHSIEFNQDARSSRTCVKAHIRISQIAIKDESCRIFTDPSVILAQFVRVRHL